jgi:hypothetical protein
VVPYQAAQYPASYVVESQMLCFTKIGPLIWAGRGFKQEPPEGVCMLYYPLHPSASQSAPIIIIIITSSSSSLWWVLYQHRQKWHLVKSLHLLCMGIQPLVTTSCPWVVT